MIHSMTGYGRKEVERGTVRLVVEMRAVNHRFSELIVRLPKTWGMMEDRIKKEVSKRVRRGRVEIGVTIEQNPQHTEDLNLNWEMAEQYIRLSSQLKLQFAIPDTLGTKELLSLPGMILRDELAATPVEEIADWLMEVIEDAADELLAMKKAEGERLSLDLRDRLQKIEEWTTQIQTMAPQVVSEYKSRLELRLSTLLKELPVDESRIAQEIALFADRIDISEEITRLHSHCVQFAEQVESEEAVGRKLDFLLQEMNREVNTIGSKANYLPIQSLAVEMKTELEKMREQVQNIE
ncbi:YicC/YloC family endoribonuclease [Brevibacillus sp. SYSU BS000544]|uniref:YicC/YloC family endoribonuclease n=1 Tax=Brevibacillus sp. SYSU BS000544 TaxID=3416443 RepID=UPI003CE4DBFC